MKLKIKENAKINNVNINSLNDLLHVLAIADTKHDFGTSYIDSTLLTLPNKPDLNKLHLNEDDFMKYVFGLVIGDDNRYRVNKEISIISNFEDIYNHQYIDEDETYNKSSTTSSSSTLSMTPTQVNCSNINNSKLLEYFKENLPKNNEVFIIIDVMGSGFNNFLSCLKDVNANSLNNTYYYVQNKQTLYDPADKVRPNTKIGKKIFDKNPNVKFAFEYVNDIASSNRSVKYPNSEIQNNKNSLNSLFYSNVNTYQILKEKNQLKTNRPYLYQSYAVFNDLNNNNTVVDANMASKNGTQKKNLKFISLANDVINELNNIFKIVGSNPGINMKPTTYNNMHKMIAKRLGDQGQALSTVLGPMSLRIQDGPDKTEEITSTNLTIFGSYDRLAVASALLFEAPIVIYNYSSAKGRGYHIFTKKELMPVHLNYFNMMKTLNSKIKEIYKLFDIPLPDKSNNNELNLFKIFKPVEIFKTIINSINISLESYQKLVTEANNKFFITNMENFNKSMDSLNEYILNESINESNYANINKYYKDSINALFANLKFINFLLSSSKSQLLEILNSNTMKSIFTESFSANGNNNNLFQQVENKFIELINKSLEQPNVQNKLLNSDFITFYNKHNMNLTIKQEKEINQAIYGKGNKLSLNNLIHSLNNFIIYYKKLKDDISILELSKLQSLYFKVDRVNNQQIKMSKLTSKTRESREIAQFNLSVLEKDTLCNYLFELRRVYRLFNYESSILGIELDNNTNKSFIENIEKRYTSLISKLSQVPDYNIEKLEKLKLTFEIDEVKIQNAIEEEIFNKNKQIKALPATGPMEQDKSQPEQQINSLESNKMETDKLVTNPVESSNSLFKSELTQKIFSMLISPLLNYPRYAFSYLEKKVHDIAGNKRQKIGGTTALMSSSNLEQSLGQKRKAIELSSPITSLTTTRETSEDILDPLLKKIFNNYKQQINSYLNMSIMNKDIEQVNPNDITISPYYFNSKDLLFKTYPELKDFNQSIEFFNAFVSDFFNYFGLERDKTNFQLNVENPEISFIQYLIKELKYSSNEANTKFKNFIENYSDFNNYILKLKYGFYMYLPLLQSNNKIINKQLIQAETKPTDSAGTKRKRVGGKNKKSKKQNKNKLIHKKTLKGYKKH